MLGLVSKVRQKLSNDIAIDLGTANTLVFVKGQGVVLDEPSVIAVGQKNEKKYVAAVGNKAKKMLGRTPGELEVTRPLKDGVIADFTVTELMLTDFIRQVSGRFGRPRIVVCTPAGSTAVERRAIREAALNSGSEVAIIDEPMASALGAGLPVDEPTGSMVIDIGGGTTEIGILSLSGTVYGDSVRVAGNRFDEAIINYVRKAHNTVIGEATAEQIKKDVGSACNEEETRETTVRGRNQVSGLPHELTLTNHEILEGALKDPLGVIVQAVHKALEQSPPELSSDIYQSGMTLTGGGALIPGLTTLLEKETGIKTQVAEDPLTCVARGCGKALEIIDFETL